MLKISWIQRISHIKFGGTKYTWLRKFRQWPDLAVDGLLLATQDRKKYRQINYNKSYQCLNIGTILKKVTRSLK